jgi:hypothetical protein
VEVTVVVATVVAECIGAEATQEVAIQAVDSGVAAATQAAGCTVVEVTQVVGAPFAVDMIVGDEDINQDGDPIAMEVTEIVQVGTEDGVGIEPGGQVGGIEVLFFRVTTVTITLPITTTSALPSMSI